MRREIFCSFLLCVALATLRATPAYAQEEVESQGSGKEESAADVESREDSSAVAACPCFTPDRLAQLPPHSPDLCVDSDLAVQIARWFGPRSAEGRQGFNIFATLPSPRTAGGACLFHRRYLTDGALAQEFKRRIDLSAERAAACHEMLRAWLGTRAGCDSVVKKDEKKRKSRQPD